jgi:tetratricopeptide (TPR) repeat protein
MARNDWFRKSTWSDSDQRDFFARLGLSRDPARKAQILRIQAGHLEAVGLAEEGLTLVDLMIERWPAPAQLAAAHLQRARCLCAVGDLEATILAFRESLNAQRALPHVHTNAYLEFGWFVVEHEFAGLYREALSVLDEFEFPSPFPIDIYQLNAIRALIADALHDAPRARSLATAALEAAGKTDSGLRYHSRLGLVHETDNSVHSRLKKLVAV